MFLFPYGVTKVDLVLEQVIISPNLSPVAEVPIIKSGCIIHSIFSYFIPYSQHPKMLSGCQ